MSKIITIANEEVHKLIDGRYPDYYSSEQKEPPTYGETTFTVGDLCMLARGIAARIESLLVDKVLGEDKG